MEESEDETYKADVYNAILLYVILFSHTPRKKIYHFYLERNVKHFLNPLTRNIDFQGIRIGQSTKLNRWNDPAFLVQNFLDDKTINSATNSLNCEKLSL